jgi:hypothetical protein
MPRGVLYKLRKLETFRRSYAKSLDPCFSDLTILVASDYFRLPCRWGRASACREIDEIGHVIDNDEIGHDIDNLQDLSDDACERPF